MFQEMINGSIAVLSRPSVSTFEEHEKNNLQWALIYSVIAGVINALLVGIGTAIGLNRVDPELGGTAQPSIVGAIFGAIIATVIGLLIYWGITYLLGRAFGGTGQFGELAYDMSLFSAPTTVIGSLLGLVPILGGIAAFALGLYNLYLTYLAIQSGMNLPSQKALYVILIQFAILLVIGLCFGLFFAAIIAMLMGASGTTAP